MVSFLLVFNNGLIYHKREKAERKITSRLKKKEAWKIKMKRERERQREREDCISKVCFDRNKQQYGVYNGYVPQ